MKDLRLVVWAKVRMLTPSTYHLWIAEIKGYANRYDVWDYIDPEGHTELPIFPPYPQFRDYAMTRTIGDNGAITTSSCTAWEELTEIKKESYLAKERTYKYIRREVTEARAGVHKVHDVILESARVYIPINVIALGVRDQLQALADKFKLSDSELRRRIDIRYEELRRSSPWKVKIEQWIRSWETLREEIIYLGFTGIYNEEIFSQNTF